MGLAWWLRVVSGSLCFICSTAVLAQAPPAKPLPSNAAELDTLLSQRDYARLSQIFRDANKFEEIVLNMNWQQTRLFSGGTAFLTFPYIANLDLVSTSLGDVRGAEMMKTAATPKPKTIAVKPAMSSALNLLNQSQKSLGTDRMIFVLPLSANSAAYNHL